MLPRLSEPDVALLLLAGPPLEPRHIFPLDQAIERVVHGCEICEVVQTLGPLLQLPRRLRAAQHQHRQQRQLSVVGVERLVEQVPVLARPAARAAGEPRPAPQRRASQRLVTVASSYSTTGSRFVAWLQASRSAFSGRQTVNANAVQSAAPRLRRVGLDVPTRRGEVPAAHLLYRQLSDELGDGAHSRYNAILARVASFAGAAEHARSS